MAIGADVLLLHLKFTEITKRIWKSRIFEYYLAAKSEKNQSFRE